MARRRKGKYKHLSPIQVAATALENLLGKREEMKSAYAAGIERFARDPEAQARYRNKVATWIDVARTILGPRYAEAAATAKSVYLSRIKGVPAPAPAPAVPVPAVARSPE